MATAILSADPSGHNAEAPKGLIRMQEAERRYGMNRQTLRSLIHAGKIRGFRPAPTAWFLIDPQSVESFLGMDLKKEKGIIEGGKYVAIYARRSDTGTKAAESLDAQVAMLIDYVVKEWGISRDDVKVYREQVSGVNLSLKTRGAWARLLNEIAKGRVQMVVVKDASRACRLPGSDELMDWLCATFGTKYVKMFGESDGDESETNSDLSVLLDYLTSWTNRRSAKKSAYVRTVRISPDVASKLAGWWQEGLSVNLIWLRAQKEGLMGTKHNGEPIPLKKQTIYRCCVKEKRKGLLAKLATPPESPFKLFSDRCLRRVPGSMVHADTVYPAYVAFCEANGLIVCTKHKLSNELRILGWEKGRDQRRVNATQRMGRTFIDCELVSG